MPKTPLTCCNSQAIHRLLPAPPPLLYPASLVPTPPTRQPPKPGARLPLISAEQMSLNCPPPPSKTPSPPPPLIRHPNRQPCRRAKQATPNV
ncbi:hypothetical protein Q5P01_005809 [Channa striata]|uniref:Uncharacterized protein n=1 Tax=Channa striata TaxID=64152 RepID=A0AA88NE98_CHASR|nr:hypothetical protein Q5P01_005809 [Channa striata]